MDMTRYLKPYLNVKELEALGGAYNGVIAAVTDEDLRNKFRGQRSTEPVISFMDGKRLVLNTTMLRQCIEFFGPDSENWIGRCVGVFLRRVESRHRETGEIRVRLHRGLRCEDVHARFSMPRLVEHVATFRLREPGDDDELPAVATEREPIGEPFASGTRRTR